ncbi:MAG: 6-pyruvoyl-tetrahydropterin synthase-related protein [Candidatus Woesebacteria bacterium]
MNRSLQAGEFPVRWSRNFGFGYGMPLFNFYAPLPYYVAQIPFALTQNAIFSIKLLIFLNAVLAFIGMYLFAKELWGKSGGLISAAAFSFSTYRAVDLYVRGAIGEATAMVLIPFALYGILRLRTHQKQGVIVTSLSLAAILLSHNLIGMITVGVVCIFAFAILGYKKMIPVLLALLLAFLLSAFYVLPAFFEKDFTRVESTITTGYFDFHNHFVALRQFVFGIWGYGGSQPGLEDGMSYALGYIPIVLAAVSLLGVIVTKKKIRTFGILVFFLLGSLFMATNKSVFVWDHVQLLKYMQFPWRFLTFVHVFLSAIVGASIVLLQKWRKIKGEWIAAVIVLLAFVAMQTQFFMPEKYIDNTDEFYSTDPTFIRTEMSKTLNDYLPKAIKDDALPDSVSERMTLTKGEGKLQITKDTPTLFSAHADCTTECELQINTFIFPGWKLFVNGKSMALAEKTTFPIYSVLLPSGESDITVQLVDTPIRMLGNTLSIIGFLSVGGFLTLSYGKRKLST